MRKLLILRNKGRLKIKSRSLLQVQFKSDSGNVVIKEYPVRNLDAILIIGKDFLIESGVLSVLASMNVPISVIAKNSVGIVMNPVITVTNHYRSLQYHISKADALSLALEYIKAKIVGMLNILKYFRKQPPNLAPPPDPQDDFDELAIRKWESVSSRLLWERLITLLKPNILRKLKNKYGFRGRKPQHPDPFNKTLSIMYTVLYSLGTKALLAVGLDPTYGLLHKTRYSTPLTFDYTEMFKPVAIQATIELLNENDLLNLEANGELTKKSIETSIRKLYNFLEKKHYATHKSLYQYIYIKAYNLSKYLEARNKKERLVIIWNKKHFK